MSSTRPVLESTPVHLPTIVVAPPFADYTPTQSPSSTLSITLFVWTANHHPANLYHNVDGAVWTPKGRPAQDGAAVGGLELRSVELVLTTVLSLGATVLAARLRR